MKPIKLFVYGKKVVKLKCPNCDVNMQIPVSVLKNKYMFKGRCKCQFVIEGELEYRKSFREEKNLDGHYSKNLETLQNVKQYDGNIVIGITSSNCAIKDLSTYGLGFQSLSSHTIKKDDILYLIFQLSVGTIIEKKVVVRDIRGDRIGCEFVDV